jgi:hypothetical protein
MANRYAVATGNWSATGTWDGGTLPAPGDTVRPNGFTVTIDQDLTGTNYILTNNASAPAAANGGFVVSSIPGGGRTLNVTLNHAAAAASNILLAVSATSGTLTINGSIDASESATSTAVNITGAGCTVVINGDLVGSVTNSSVCVGLAAANVTLTVVGNVTSGFTNAAQCISIAAAATSATVTVTGNVTGNSGPAIQTAVSSSGTMTINGNLTGTNGSSSIGLYLFGGTWQVTVNGNVLGSSQSGGSGNSLTVQAIGATSTVTVNGDVSGGAGGGGSTGGIRLTSGATIAAVTVNGNVTGGTSTAPGILMPSSNVTLLTITGDVTATATAPAIGGGVGFVAASPTGGAIDIQGDAVASTARPAQIVPASAILRLQGDELVGANGHSAVVAARRLHKSTGKVRRDFAKALSFPTISGTVSLTNFEDNGLPAEADVRLGTTYADDDTLTGTQHPALTAQAVWDALVADLDTPGSIGARLRDAATVASTGAQLAAALDSL